MAMAIDDKYVVTNRLTGAVIPDAVVIRKQDLFAGPALHSYAHAIAAVAQALMPYDLARAKALQGIADYFAECALDSDSMVTKLPD